MGVLNFSALLLFVTAVHGADSVHGPPPGPSLSHGPMVGAVDSDSVRIWARADGTAPQTYALAVTYGVTGDPTGTTTAAEILDQSDDFTGTIEISGLLPRTDYWFRIVLDGAPQPDSDGSFATLAPSGEAGAFSFAIGSCNDHLQMPYPVFSPIGMQDLAFFIHAGDIIYADRAPAAATRAEFEDRYKLNFAESNWLSLMKELPFFMTWDDHEIENDWSGGQSGLYLEARPAFDAYVAAHNPPPRVPGELYYDFSAGEVDFFVLDTRSHRDSGVPTMLGPVQLDELKNWLLSSTADFKFIVSSVQWTSIAQKVDTWHGFQAERAEIFDFVHDNAVRGVVLLSGDRHWIGVFRHEHVDPFFLYEFSSSPLGAEIGQAPAPDAETLFLDDSARAFMRFDVDTSDEPATMTARVINESGQEIYQLTLSEEDIHADFLYANGFEE